MSTINEKVQQLNNRLAEAPDEVGRIDLLNTIAYEVRHADSAASLQQSRLAADLSQKAGYQKGLAAALLNEGFAEMVQANYTTAFQTLHKASAIFEEINDLTGKAHALYNIGVVYNRIAEYNQALDAFQHSLSIRQSIGNQKGEAACLYQLAYIYERFGNNEKSYDCYSECLAMQKRIGDKAGVASALMGRGILKQKRKDYAAAEKDFIQSLLMRAGIGETHGWLVAMNYLGEFYLEKDDLATAQSYLEGAVEVAVKQEPPFLANLCRLYTSLAKIYTRYKDYDKAIQYMEQALATAEKGNLHYQVYDIHFTLSDLYKHKGDFEKALASYEKYHLSKEEIINLKAGTKLKNLELVNQIEDEKKKAEIHRLRHIELKNAYEELQAAQEQLIQSEKMASLGMLTAGIAHEIQNPLNFVNNFSEINKELVEEMTGLLRQGNLEEAKAVAAYIGDNSEKIHQHGRRADGIVKGMLLHSRGTSGAQEPTDINALADEYLRLAYHGLRAKEKFFHATIKTDYDGSIDHVSLNPQDIGRVLLNLISNAFYAVNAKKSRGSGGYEPTVWVSTKKEGDMISVSVKDNGTGIPQKAVDKIFQPFFTTKPTGQGTGLGLSLAYDIVTAHGGTLKVESQEGEGAEFIMQLPISA